MNEENDECYKTCILRLKPLHNNKSIPPTIMSSQPERNSAIMHI